MHTDLIFYAIAIPAVVLMGLAKGGFSGVGQISVPLLATVVSPVQAAAILLPILLVQDAVGVWAFRRDWDAHILKVMVPGAAVGILAGYLLGEQWEHVLRYAGYFQVAALAAMAIGLGYLAFWIMRRRGS